MSRIEFDHYGRWSEACSAVDALGVVGMRQEDLGALWLASASPNPPLDGSEPSDRYEMTLAGVGKVQMTGWVAAKAMKILGEGLQLDLPAVLSGALDDPGEIDRIRETLRSGGGIVGVRARDEPPTTA